MAPPAPCEDEEGEHGEDHEGGQKISLTIRKISVHSARLNSRARPKQVMSSR